MNALDALENAYRQDPCGVLANPLWKTAAIVKNCQTWVALNEHGQVRRFEAWQGDELQVYWDAAGAWAPSAPVETWRRPAFAVLNSRYTRQLALTADYLIQRFFRLQARAAGETFALPVGYSFAPVRLPAEAALASQIIGRCYPYLRPNLDEVLRWTEQATFDPHLWLWVIDQRSQQPAGLGIGEFDRVHGEASLEWIQVLPEFRGQGLAKALVSRLLGQLAGQAWLVTVSGEADNPSDPEHLYRRCGFQGRDVWWVVHRLGT